MAYRPQDPYNNYNYGNTGAAQGYPPQTGYGDSSNWDAKSYQSSYAGSQAHLNPNAHEMTQVAPPMPYANTNQYPPGPPRPAPYRDNTGGSGWSAAREKLMKRRSVRQVQLTQGNLVLDVPAPSNIVPGDKTGIEEFSKMRYTAATCDPDDFMSSRYTLRPYLMGRQTELFIVMTMYNEDEVLFVRTMNSYVPSVSF